VAAENRSAHPNLPGVPWWAAVLIAVIGTTIGFAIEAGSGNKELGGVFSAMYALGCVIAVLAVRHSGIFTAVIQPPLILFVAVPGAYFLFHGAEFTGLKNTLINCGYPLIERFPLMLFTTAGVLLIGMARWYFAMAGTVASAAATSEGATAAEPGRFAGLAAKFGAVFSREAATEVADSKPKRKHSIDRPATAEKRPRSGRPAQRSGPTRSRHARPPLEDITEAGPERPRRRPRPPRDGDPRTPPPRRREPREPRERRDPYAPPPRRDGRHEQYPPFEPYRPYDPYPPYEPPPARRRPPPEDSTHHPVSRVRYRGSEDENPGRPRYER
jgi:hypothetical protein